MEVKDKIKRAAAQIKNLAASKAAPVSSDSDVSIIFPRDKKASNSFLPSQKHQMGNNSPKHHGDQRYCILCNKAGIPEGKWNCIAPKISLVKVPTIHPSSMDWEGP